MIAVSVDVPTFPKNCAFTVTENSNICPMYTFEACVHREEKLGGVGVDHLPSIPALSATSSNAAMMMQSRKIMLPSSEQVPPLLH